MRPLGTLRIIPLLLAGAISAVGCDRVREQAAPVHPIVGTWQVHDPNAPFPHHLYVFNADGTMQQANPDAGNPRGSDSDGKGIWVNRGDRIDAKWVELSADRATHQYTGRLELTMRIVVQGDSLTATETAALFDATGGTRAGAGDSQTAEWGAGYAAVNQPTEGGCGILFGIKWTKYYIM